MIKDRFQVTKIQTILENDIRKLHDAFSNSMTGNYGDNFENSLAAFKSHRNKYYRLNLLRQKLDEELAKRK